MKTLEIMSPALDTRAGRMLAAGTLTATIKSLRTGDHITIKATCKAKVDGRWQRAEFADATHVFFVVPSSTGWGDKVGTWRPQTGRWYTDDYQTDAARIWAALEALRVACGGAPHTQSEFLEANRCGRCGRKLTDPESIVRGIGPECAEMATGSHHETRVYTPVAC